MDIPISLLAACSNGRSEEHDLYDEIVDDLFVEARKVAAERDLNGEPLFPGLVRAVEAFDKLMEV